MGGLSQTLNTFKTKLSTVRLNDCSKCSAINSKILHGNDLLLGWSESKLNILVHSSHIMHGRDNYMSDLPLKYFCSATMTVIWIQVKHHRNSSKNICLQIRSAIWERYESKPSTIWFSSQIFLYGNYRLWERSQSKIRHQHLASKYFYRKTICYGSDPNPSHALVDLPIEHIPHATTRLVNQPQTIRATKWIHCKPIC